MTVMTVITVSGVEAVTEVETEIDRTRTEIETAAEIGIENAIGIGSENATATGRENERRKEKKNEKEIEIKRRTELVSGTAIMAVGTGTGTENENENAIVRGIAARIAETRRMIEHDPHGMIERRMTDEETIIETTDAMTSVRMRRAIDAKTGARTSTMNERMIDARTIEGRHHHSVTGRRNRSGWIAAIGNIEIMTLRTRSIAVAMCMIHRLKRRRRDTRRLIHSASTSKSDRLALVYRHETIARAKMHRRMLSHSKAGPRVQSGHRSVKIAMSTREAMEDAGMVAMTMRTMRIRQIWTMVQDKTIVMGWRRSRSGGARTRGRWTCQ